MAIDQLRIQNFQSHTTWQLDLDPGITTIVGPSDVGKSAVTRALGWVCRNTPAGDAHVRHGTKGCTVALTVDGHRVVRRRGKGVNSYELDGTKFHSFGNTVPDPVAAVLNISEVNWQGQHDPPFWFSSTGGQVSRDLNAVVDLGVIDESLKAIGAVVTKALADTHAAEDAMAEAYTHRGETRWWLVVASDLEEVEDAAAAADAAEERAEELAGLVADATTAGEAAEVATRRAAALQKVVAAGKAAQAAHAAHSGLVQALSAVRTARKAAQAGKAAAADLHQQVEESKPKGRCPICGRT